MDRGPHRRHLSGLFRLWLGLAQMGGAAIAVTLFWETGLSGLTIAATILTTVLTFVSLALYVGHSKSPS